MRDGRRRGPRWRPTWAGALRLWPAAPTLVAPATGRQSVAVEMPGGTLEVGFDVADGAPFGITLSGPAETVYEGTLEWRGA